jgi:thiol-disulfide isomerase/thioredoxin
LAGEFSVGSKLAAIQVNDHGTVRTVNLAGNKPTAVIFVSTQCPVSNAYNGRMASLYADYESKNFNFVFVNANSTEDQATVDQHAKQQGWAFPVYKDPGNKLADQLNAQVTPEVFLFDKTGTLLYHGRIDDSQKESGIRTKDARAAFDAVLGGKAVPVAETKAFGCTIKRSKAS